MRKGLYIILTVLPMTAVAGKTPAPPKAKTVAEQQVSQVEALVREALTLENNCNKENITRSAKATSILRDARILKRNCYQYGGSADYCEAQTLKVLQGEKGEFCGGRGESAEFGCKVVFSNFSAKDREQDRLDLRVSDRVADGTAQILIKELATSEDKYDQNMASLIMDFRDQSKESLAYVRKNAGKRPNMSVHDDASLRAFREAEKKSTYEYLYNEHLNKRMNMGGGAWLHISQCANSQQQMMNEVPDALSAWPSVKAKQPQVPTDIVAPPARQTHLQ